MSTSSLKTLLQFILGVAISIGAALLLRIEPQETYGWFMGAVHGFLLVPNFLISLFDPSWIVKAPLHTSMYNFDWWVAGIFDILYWIWIIAGAIWVFVHRPRN